MHILIAEDDPVMRSELKILLENAMYQVTALETFGEITQTVYERQPDLVLLDVNLPEASGFDICTQIREKMIVPVIFLTGRGDSMDELTGLLKGGDDYIVKPFQAPVLLARIAAVLKRTTTVGRYAAREGERTEGIQAHRQEQKVANIRGMELDLARCCLCCQGETAELTKSEMKILYFLFLHEGEFVSRLELVEYLWENQVFIDDNTLSVHVARIREKLRKLGAQNFIETRRGIGYRI